MKFKFRDREFIPVLLGGDINTYSMARAFYEEYQVKTYIFGKYPTGPSFNSRIIEYTPDPRIDQDDYFLTTINHFATSHHQKKILLIGCGDSYVALISKHKTQLAENIIAPYIDFDLMDSLQQKQTFYQLCDTHGIDYPSTLVYTKDMGDDFKVDFTYPVILKPSNGVTYWEHPFVPQNKVYTIESKAELISVIHQIYDAGYPDSLIIQDMIPGNDEFMYVLTSYSDHKGQVQMMCLGHVLLEEHTPHGLGNHAIILTESNKELMDKAKTLLEDLHYVGFSNFDIKYDSRDQKYKFFEINTRQGRSNYYVTGSGYNLAKYVVDDYIYHRKLSFTLGDNPHMWMVVPKAVANEYVSQERNRDAMKDLIREHKMVNPVFKKGDLSPKRFYAMFRTHLSHFVKFKKYYSK